MQWINITVNFALRQNLGLKISHKILSPYTRKYAFLWLLFLCVIYDVFELWSMMGPRLFQNQSVTLQRGLIETDQHFRFTQKKTIGYNWWQTFFSQMVKILKTKPNC